MFLVQILNFNFWGFSEKNDHFGGLPILCRTGLFFGVVSMHFRVFS